ncbi:hypothetical protein OEZ86_005971 [Tetradesmus obliquus]|nr:hypothetical protein OEZ86_005971 [Tetradesmus obliquus]
MHCDGDADVLAARSAARFKPVQRELRTCGSCRHICSRCWPFIAVAIQVVRALSSSKFCGCTQGGAECITRWLIRAQCPAARLLADDVRAPWGTCVAKADRMMALRPLSGQAAKALEKSLDNIIFVCIHPCLHVEVTKKMNYLLKAQFCVHPKTGNLCVPIDPDTELRPR